MDTNEAFTGLYLLHDRGETPDNVERLEQIVTQRHPIEVLRPYLPHGNLKISTEQAYLWLTGKYLGHIRAGSLLVGIGLSGLLAARLQERMPELRLSVLAVNSPTSDDGVMIETGQLNRVAVYSSQYKPIVGRCDWQDYALNFDTPLFQHGAYLQQHLLANVIVANLRREDIGEKLNRALTSARE